MIRKERPDWQMGRLNGVGGRIEQDKDGFDTVNAMRRECAEEIGLDIEQARWKHVCTLLDESIHHNIVFVFVAIHCTDTALPLDRAIRQMTDEKPLVVACKIVFQLDGETLPNLRWLIPMAQNALRGKDKADHFKITEVYK